MHIHPSQSSDSLSIHWIASILKVYSQCLVHISLLDNAISNTISRADSNGDLGAIYATGGKWFYQYLRSVSCLLKEYYHCYQ